MKKLEVVVREKPREIVYLRNRDASVENASKYRLMNIINFAKLAHNSYGKSYEEMINNIRYGMKPVGRAVKERVIELEPIDLLKIKIELIKRGISRARLPEGYKIKIKGEEEKKEEIERMKKLVFA